MITVSLISDIGTNSNDLARFKLRFRKQVEGAELEVLKADIDRHKITEAAYIADCMLPEMGKNDLLIVDVESDMLANGPALLAACDDQWIITSNSGFLHMLGDRIGKVYAAPDDWVKQGATFTLLNTYLPLLKHFLKDGVQGLKPFENLKERAGLQPVIEENGMRGTVIYVDNFGNAITNIQRETFEEVRNGRKMLIRLNRHETKDSVVDFYSATGDGEVAVVWTSNGHLQVSIYHGNASRLLGLTKEKMISIKFE